MDLAFYGNVMLALLKEDAGVTRPWHTSCFDGVHLLREMSISDLPEVAEEAPSEPDLGDT